MKKIQSACAISASHVNNFAAQTVSRLSTARAVDGVERDDRTSVFCTTDFAPENHRDLGACYVS